MQIYQQTGNNMRARKVYESVQFQRGADPKTSLSIGLADKIGKEWQELVDDGVSINIAMGRNEWYVIVLHHPPARPEAKKVEEVWGEYLHFPGQFHRSNDLAIPIKPGYEEAFKQAYNERYPNWKLGF
jgi:hypothetical protein